MVNYKKTAHCEEVQTTKKNLEAKPDEKEKENTLLKGTSIAIVIIGVLKAFFKFQNSAIRWFELFLAVAFFFAFIGTTYDLVKKLRLSRAQEIEPLCEMSKAPQPQRVKVLLSGLPAIAIAFLASLFAFAKFTGLSVSELMSTLIQ